ncbi:hypothetical protein GE061_000961 [Apolygus lucorum]|uniref:Uncharacterized protein n=1 Tax=Apolygus lucorum TaxID=248454 RepID=A0A8S9Y5S6_APOLU|nr:hypothetical protein GE061_000961 [Apolygus lucorum]
MEMDSHGFSNCVHFESRSFTARSSIQDGRELRRNPHFHSTVHKFPKLSWDSNLSKYTIDLGQVYFSML